MAKYIVAMDASVYADSASARTAITDSGATVSEIFSLPLTYEIDSSAEQLANIAGVSYSSLSDDEISIETQRLDTGHFKFLDNRLGSNSDDTQAIQGDDAFRPNYKGDGVTVYIIDTGVKFDHPEFANSNISSLSSVFNDSGEDIAGHGTAVSSLIVGENIGIAKNAGVLSVKLFNSLSGNVTISNVITALSSVKSHHDTNDTSKVKVVCLPWTTAQNNFIDAKIAELNSANLVVVASAGNHNQPVNNYSPAGVEEIITVGSVDSRGNITNFTNLPFGPSDVVNPLTNYGAAVDVFTIGEGVPYAEIKSPDEDYLIGEGTSLSAGIVAGGVASYIQKHTDKSAVEIKDILISEGSVRGKQFIRVDSSANTSIDINQLNLSLLSLDAESSTELFTTPSGRIMNIQVNNIANVDLGLNNTASNVEVLTFSPLSPWMSFNNTTGIFEANTNSLPANVSPGIYLFAVRGEVAGNVMVEEFSVGVYSSDISELDDTGSFYYDTDNAEYDPVETVTYEGAVPSKN
jgi:subtilisin family serine protease